MNGQHTLNPGNTDRGIATQQRAAPAAARQPIEDDKVMLRYTWTATHGRELMGIPATGKSVIFTGMIMDRISGGKIEEHWEQLDMMGLMQQLGAIPTPGE